jgi:hypothetical protein
MIKIENFKEFGIETAIRGVRLSYKSGDKSDSFTDDFGVFHLGEKDHKLLLGLSKKSDSESTFMRHMIISMDVTAPLMWWKQMDRYSVGKSQLSESTMHTLMIKELTLDDFSWDGLEENIYTRIGTGVTKDTIEITPNVVFSATIEKLNCLIRFYKDYKANGTDVEKEKKLAEVERLVELLLPESYLQKRTITMNYAVFKHMYYDRYSPKKHKMLEWSQFVEAVLDVLDHKEFIDEKLLLIEERDELKKKLGDASNDLPNIWKRIKEIDNIIGESPEVEEWKSKLENIWKGHLERKIEELNKKLTKEAEE